MNNESVRKAPQKLDSHEIKEAKTSEVAAFDLEKLRLSQDFHETVGVKKALTTVPVRKPAAQDFSRVHSGEDMHLETAILEVKEDREDYLVNPDLWGELSGEIIPKVLYTTINRQGVLTLWPIRLPGEDGRHNPWHRSAIEAAEMAKIRWIRVQANMSLGAYEIYEALGVLSDPEWPDYTFSEILQIAFKDRLIDSMDHPVLRRLRGEL